MVLAVAALAGGAECGGVLVVVRGHFHVRVHIHVHVHLHVHDGQRPLLSSLAGRHVLRRGRALDMDMHMDMHRYTTCFTYHFGTLCDGLRRQLNMRQRPYLQKYSVR